MPNKTLEKWEEKTIKQLSILICDGDWIESKNQSSCGIRLIQTGNVGNGFYKDKPENSRYISDETFKKLNCTEIFSGDCLVSRLPEPLGRACLIPDKKERMITAVDCSVIRFNEECIIPKYFIYYSMSNTYNKKIINLSTGATRQRISRKNLETITIPIPKMPEQQRIVGILDKAFENIEKAKQNTLQNLNNAKELLESNLNFLFNSDNKWNEVKLEEIADITSSKRIYKSDYVKNGIPFYRTKEIKELAHNLPISIELYISEEKFNEIANKFGIPKENDLLISAVGTIGEIYVVKKNDKFYFKDGNLIWFRNIKENVNTKFLKYILRAYVKTIQNMTNGAAYNALTIEKLKIYNINLPPLEEQQKIVAQLDELQEQTKKLEQIYEQKIKDLDELKQSILQKAFNGEL